MPTLQLSKDRKVATSFTPSGAVRIANSIGLKSGPEGSCMSATVTCDGCYAHNLERAYTNVRNVMETNLAVLRTMTYLQIVGALVEALETFEHRCDKFDAEKLFRIHWDGDFYSTDYARAWTSAVALTPDTTFWVYTRDADAYRILMDAHLPNLRVWFSVDRTDQVLTGVNQMVVAQKLAEEYGERFGPASLAPTFAEAQAMNKELIGKPGAKCPELTGQIPLNGACQACRLCIDKPARAIAFSLTKR